MNSARPVEHFVTLFDSNFLPMGLALHDSLVSQGPAFHLWIICMDEAVEQQLERIALPQVTLLPLGKCETPELLAVKPGRTRGEYCWTFTPFTFQAVFDRDATVERVTYLDADLFFFADPGLLLAELDAAHKQVLITDHAYAPEHEFFIPLSGRFCVQFLTFRRTPGAAKVMRWWQERCLEWCFARHEDGKFGDQKYLDAWPELFPDEVHIVNQVEKTLAPWNELHFEKALLGRIDPVFYHFQGVKLIRHDTAKLYHYNYTIGKQGLRLYRSYQASLRKAVGTMKQLGIAVPWFREDLSFKRRVLNLLRKDPRIAKIG
jgi:hypothetical protein